MARLFGAAILAAIGGAVYFWILAITIIGFCPSERTAEFFFDLQVSPIGLARHWLGIPWENGPLLVVMCNFLFWPTVAMTAVMPGLRAVFFALMGIYYGCAAALWFVSDCWGDGLRILVKSPLMVATWCAVYLAGQLVFWMLVLLVWKKQRGAPAAPRRRWYQYSLRTVLVLVILVSIAASWFAVKTHPARRQRAAVEAIKELGGWVKYDYETKEEPPGPPWLRKLLGDDIVSDVVAAGELKSDAALAHLKTFTQLKELHLLGPQITDHGLEHLEGLRRLDLLEFTHTQVTDAGLEYLKGLTQLWQLDLSGTKVTDAGLEHLKGLAQLHSLDLMSTQVSDEGVNNLRQALPNCDITWHRPPLEQPQSPADADPQ